MEICWALESGSWPRGYSSGGRFTRLIPELPYATITYPPNGSSNVELTTIFRWTKIDSASSYLLRVYDSRRLNNVVYEVYSNSDSSRIPAGQLQNSRTYWWRIKPFKTGGEGPISDAATLNTVQASELPPPSLISPAYGAVGVSVIPYIDWLDVTNAVNYRLQISSVPDFTSTIIDDNTLVNSHFTVPAYLLTTNTTYYWRVATKGTVSWSPFSITWNFTTYAIPAPVILSSPLNSSTSQPIDISLNWFRGNLTYSKHNTFNEVLSISGNNKFGFKVNDLSFSPEVDRYWLEFTSDTSMLQGLTIDSLLTDTVKNISGLTFSTGYYWRVKAHNDMGWGEYSPWWKFTTTNGAPVLIEPVNNQTEVPVTPVLNWSDIAGAVKYRVQVSAYGSFAVLWIDDSNSVTSQYQVPPGILAYNSLYYWRVKTKNTAQWSEFQSPIRFFTQVNPPPSAPILSAPVNGMTGASLTPLLDWNNISGSIKFRLQVSAIEDFSTKLLDDSSITSSEYSVPAGILTQGNRYYWRAAVRGSSSWSAFSAAWNFTTFSLPPVVTLLTPANNSTGQLLNIAFTWSNSGQTATKLILENGDRIIPFNMNKSGKQGGAEGFPQDDPADKYWFELTRDTNTPAAFYLDSALTDTSKSVSGLEPLASYYWRVKAGNSAGWGAYTSWWKFTTSSGAPPEPPLLLSPANLSYDLPVTPLMDWADAPQAVKYHVQVSAYGTFSVLWIDDSSSSVSQFQVPQGVLAYNSGYYWRVRARNEMGWGNYQSAYRFFTLVSPPPQAPVLQSPANGAFGITLAPLLDWIDAGGATKYRVQLSVSPGFASLIIDDSAVTSSSYQLPAGVLNNNTQYFWRVSAKNSVSWGSYSQVWNFTTTGVPGPVILVSPANNSVEQPLNLNFTWNRAIENADLKYVHSNTGDRRILSSGKTATDAISGYWFQLTTDTISLGGAVQDSALTDTTKQVGGLVSLFNYYWRVKAKNETGWGAFSSWWKFTTSSALPPSAPVLVSPVYGAADIPVTPLLDWSDSQGASKYRVQVSAYGSFTVLWIDDSSASLSQYQVPSGILAYNSGYYWRVKAKNDFGWGNYQSPSRFFTLVNPPPQAPILVSPANNAAGVPLSAVLDWNDVSGAIKYKVQVSTVQDFSSILISDTSVTGSGYNVAAGILNSNSIYYWRAAAKNSSTWSSYSQVWSFHTISVPQPVILVNPPNNSTEQPLNLTFAWRRASEDLIFSAGNEKFSGSTFSRLSLNGSTGSDAIQSYWFELCSDTVSSQFIVKDSLLNDTSKAVSGLSGASVYYWRVRAKNEIGWGTFGSWWKFTTVSGLPPAAPVLLSPTNGSAEVPVTPLIDWSDSPGAAKYRIQVSAYSSFAVLWIDDSSSTVSQYQVNPGILAYNSGYFWRVKAKNDAGWGNYQSAFRFFTQVTPPPQPPVLQSPVNGASNVPLEAVLDWSDVQGAVKYRIQASAEIGFTSPLADDSGLTSSGYTVLPGVFSNNTQYFWRVSVKKGTSWSSFSAPWGFTTVTAVNPPALHYPILRDTGVVVTPGFEWSNTPGALKYRLQVSAYSNFAVLWIDMYVTDTSYLTPPGILAYNSRYFWRVKTVRSVDSSGYSAVWNFFTKITPGTDNIPPPVGSVVLDLPPHRGTDSKVSQTLEVCKDTLFAESVFEQRNVTGQVEIPAAMLDEYSTYFWRIRNGEDKKAAAKIYVFATYELVEPVLSRPGDLTVPEKFALYQNYPNPFNPDTKIRFDIAGKYNEAVKVDLSIYDVLGRQVVTLISKDMNPGTYEAIWDAADSPSGIYFFRLTTTRFTDAKKMILLR